MTVPHLVARADARPGVGLGHVVRTLALAEAWCRAGGTADLLVDRLDASIRRLTGDAPIAVHEVGPDPSDVAAAASARATDWIVLDGYVFDAAWQRDSRVAGAQMLLLDDHAEVGSSVADLVLDQNAGARASVYEPTPSLVGPQFALLRQRENVASEVAERKGPRVVATFGGSPGADAVSLLSAVAAALPEVTFDVLGPMVDPGLANVHAHGLVADPTPWFDRADVALSAAGSTAWEFCHLGVPMVLVTVAPNQLGVADAIAEAGAGESLGALREVEPALAVARLSALLDDPERQTTMAAAGRALIDGQGADRVANELRQRMLTIDRATVEDAELLFDWVNDPAVRAASFTSEPIDWETHCAWLRRKVVDPNCRHFIARRHGVPVGQVRFDRTETGAEVDVSVAPAARGLRLASVLIEAGSRAAADLGGPLRASIRRDNAASIHSFAAAGYRAVDSSDAVIHMELVV